MIGVLLGRPAVRLGPDGEPIPETIGRRAARMAPPATLLGLLVSLGVHLVLLAIAAVVAIGGAQAGGAGEGGMPPVELAIITETELAAMQGGTVDAEAPAAPEVDPTLTMSLELLDTSVSAAISDVGSQPLGGGALAGAGDILGPGGFGDGDGLGGAGGGAASFFGAEARGTRFAYIVDVSGSMAYDDKLDMLKRELSRSIDALLENAKFFVVSFSSDSIPLGGKREWTDAADVGKAWARKTISTFGAGGSTLPGPAFEMVFSLRPKPDAVYFMTDGQFDPEVALLVLRLNAEQRIPVHCIGFASKESEDLMKRIAADSGGTYTYFTGTRK